VEVSDEVAAELSADKRYEKSYTERVRYNKAYYSLDVEDGIETSAFGCHSDNPETIFAMMDNHCRLCRALNALPEIQGRRIEAHYLLGKSIKEIAGSEGVCIRSVYESIERGLKAMKKVFENNAQGCPQNCP